MLVALVLGLAVLGAAPAPASAAYPCGAGVCPWSGWMPLSFTHNSRPLTIVAILPGGPGGRLQAIVADVWASAGSADVFFGISSQVDPNGTTWTTPTALGAGPLDPDELVGHGYQGWSAFRDGAGFIHVWAAARHCAHCLQNTVEHTDQTANGWSDWTGDAAAFLPTAAGLNADGRLEVFGENDGSDFDLVPPSGLSHRWQLAPGGWSTPAVWSTAPKVRSTVGRNADGRLEVFSGDDNNGSTELTSAWQISVNGSWTPLNDMNGGDTAVTSSVNDADGRLEIFGTKDGAPVNAWQWAPNQTISPLAPMPALPTASGPFAPFLEAARDRDGRLEVFTINSTGAVMNSWQRTPGSAFGPWSPLSDNTPAGHVDVVTNADGHLVAYTGTQWNVQQT
jgi:hypothetical protein